MRRTDKSKEISVAGLYYNSRARALSFLRPVMYAFYNSTALGLRRKLAGGMRRAAVRGEWIHMQDRVTRRILLKNVLQTDCWNLVSSIPHMTFVNGLLKLVLNAN